MYFDFFFLSLMISDIITTRDKMKAKKEDAIRVFSECSDPIFFIRLNIDHAPKNMKKYRIQIIKYFRKFICLTLKNVVGIVLQLEHKITKKQD